MLDNNPMKENIPNINLSNLKKFEDISLFPGCLEEETNPHLATSHSQVVEESDQSPPEPLFLQA